MGFWGSPLVTPNLFYGIWDMLVLSNADSPVAKGMSKN